MTNIICIWIKEYLLPFWLSPLPQLWHHTQVIHLQVWRQKNKENNTNSNQPPYKADSNLPSVLSTVPIRGTYVTLYHLPNGTAPNSILVDKDGIVWCVGSKMHDLFRFDPNTNSLEEYDIPGENDGTDYRMSWSMVQDNEGNICSSLFINNSHKCDMIIHLHYGSAQFIW